MINNVGVFVLSNGYVNLFNLDGSFCDIYIGDWVDGFVCVDCDLFNFV